MTTNEALAEAKEIVDNLYLYMRPSAIKRWEQALSVLRVALQERDALPDDTDVKEKP